MKILETVVTELKRIRVYIREFWDRNRNFRWYALLQNQRQTYSNYSWGSRRTAGAADVQLGQQAYSWGNRRTSKLK